MSLCKIPFNNASDPSLLTIATTPTQEETMSRLAKGVQIDTLMDQHTAVESVVLDMRELERALVVIGMKKLARKLRGHADRLHDVMYKLDVISSCLIEEDAKK